MGKILSDSRCAPFLAAIADERQNRKYVHGVFADFLEELGEMEEALAQRIAASGGMQLAWCPPGRFTMGSPKTEPERYRDEDQVEVNLTRGFWMGVHPVTQEEYQKILGTNPSYFCAESVGQKGIEGLDTSRFPVESVTYGEVLRFCEKWTEHENKAGRLPEGWEYRLPTEAQWEYACRSGTTTITPFGDSLSSHQANFDGVHPYNGAKKGGRIVRTAKAGPSLWRTTTVGSYPANDWGLMDMLGNACGWCLDGYQKKLPGGNDPLCKRTDGRWVIRGGSWDAVGHQCRSAARSWGVPADEPNANLGIRVVMVSTNP